MKILYSKHPKNRRITTINYKVILLSILSICVSIYIYYTIIQYLFVRNHFDAFDGTEGKLCPACFGNKACPAFFRGEININGMYRLPFLQRFKTRQIYEATSGLHQNKKPIMLKKLATNSERASADEFICSSTYYKNLNNKCIPRDALWDYIEAQPSKSIHLSLIERTKYTSPMMHCVTGRLFSLLKERFYEKSGPPESVLLHNDEIMILYNLYLNQQALMLQLFPAKDGFPFPKYLGSCGRWMIEEHAGSTIDKFCHVPFWKKVKIIKNILSLPDKLVNKSDKDDFSITKGFSLYIGDNNPENYIIHKNSLDVKLVDLEHMLVVDTEELNKLKMDGYDEVHSSPSNPCGQPVSSPNYWNCTEAVPRDVLCSKIKSDHNIQAVCSMLLQHDIRECLLSGDDRLKEVVRRLEDCVRGGENGVSRIQAFDELKKKLDQLMVTKSVHDTL